MIWNADSASWWKRTIPYENGMPVKMMLQTPRQGLVPGRESFQPHEVLLRRSISQDMEQVTSAIRRGNRHSDIHRYEIG